MKVGILGTGFGSYHASVYNKMENIDSIEIFGRNHEKLNKLKQDLQIGITSNIDDIIASKDIDLVDICLPGPLHREYAVLAMKNGKNIFCETPATLNLEDALAIKEAAKQYGRKAFVDMFIRFEKPYEYLYSVVNGNSLGKLKALHIRRKTPHMWGDLGLERIVTNLMIHEFDFVTWLLGSPTKIAAAGVEGKEGESHVTALLNYDDTVVEVQSSSMMPDCHAFTVAYEAMFEHGTIEYKEDGYSDRVENSLRLFTSQDIKDIEIKETNCWEDSIKHVLECSEKDIPTRLSMDDAIESLKIAFEVRNTLLNKYFLD